MNPDIQLRGTNHKVFKSDLRDETHFYLKIGKEGNAIQMLEKDFVPMGGYNYRIVHNLIAASALHHADSLFVDEEFTIDPKKQFPKDEILVQRLSTLYGVTNLPPFFDLGSKPTYLENFQKDFPPHCIKQLALFDTAHYKSMFISQDYVEKGKYILTANINGRYEVISVDDRVPIYKKTLQPIWGLRYDNPWQIILIKAYAKIKGGYDKVAKANPFQFIETFSNSTWKYFNLQKEPEKFMKHYYANKKFKNGKIILKTKNDEAMNEEGIVSNSACYQLMGLYEEFNKGEKRPTFVMAVRTTEQVKWQNGEHSFYRPFPMDAAKTIESFSLNLDHDVLMNEIEFLRYFVSAYITSTRHEDYYTGYKILDILKNERKAQHFEFVVPKEGFFDFSVLQFEQNRMVNISEQSKIFVSDLKSNASRQSNVSGFEMNDSKRYLRIKYILVRDGLYEGQGENGFGHKDKSQNSKIQAIQGVNSEYPITRFTTYQIQYFKGYRKGEAHFVKLDPGRYILRLKSEKMDQNAKYAVNWTCSHRIDLVPAKLTLDEEVDILHDTMISIMHKFPHFSFDKQTKTEMITIGNSFEEIGYGFISVKCAFNCNRSIIVEVDPKKLDEEGYRLKGKFKIHSDNMKAFAVKIDKGEYNSIVFKRKKNSNNFVWPPTAINVYKRELKASNESQINQLNLQPNVSKLSYNGPQSNLFIGSYASNPNLNP